MMGNSVLTRLRQRRPAKGQPVLTRRQAVGLRAMIASAGRELQNDRTYDWDGLTRTKGGVEFALLQHTFSGRGHLLYEGRAMDVWPGQTMLLSFPHANRYWAEPGDRWDFFYVCLRGPELMRLWRESAARLGPLARLSDHTLEVAADACLTAIDQQVRGPGHNSALAYSIVTALVDEVVATPSPADRPRAIQRAVDFATQRLDQPVDVDDLAAAAGYSRWHFTRLFQRSEGVSPAAWLNHQRLEAAARMLHATDLSVKRIASRCGFADPNYFAKAFRRLFGASPSAFRHSGMYRR